MDRIHSPDELQTNHFLVLFQLTIARHCGLGSDYAKKSHTYSALSRCNGNGSFKLTATLAAQQQNQSLQQRNNDQKCHSDVTGLGDGSIRNGNSIIVSSAAMPIARNSLNKNDDKYRQRFVSVSSQSTLLTTISKADGNGIIVTKAGGTDGINNNHDIDNSLKANQVRRKSSSASTVISDKNTASTSSTLGTIAEKLRRGTRKVLLFKTNSNSAPSTVTTVVVKEKERKLEKGSSVDSAHTNTISNSSLQEVDDDEFESTELAKYMGQINSEIR